LNAKGARNLGAFNLVIMFGGKPSLEARSDDDLPEGGGVGGRQSGHRALPY
jgi:hypothetical protein